MKKITAIVPDEIDGAILSGLLAISTEFNIEVIANGSAAPQKHRRIHVAGKTGGSVIMEHFTASGIFRRDQAQSWLSKLGYAQSTAGSWLSTLVKQGYLEQTGPSRFRFVKPYGNEHEGQ